MSDRRSNVLRNVLALAAISGGTMPIGFGTPMPRLSEEDLLSMRCSVALEDARRALRYFRFDRAAEVLEQLRDAGVAPTDEVLRMLDPPPPIGEQMAALLRVAARAPKREKYTMRPLTERKERRRKRKQRRNR